MRIEGEHRFEAPRERVWEALLDPEVLAGTLPGFQRLERTADNEYEGQLALGVGPVQGKFDGKVALLDLEPPVSYRLRMSGRGAPGWLEGEGAIRLEEDGSGTRLFYDIDTKIGGKVAALGQRMLEMTAKMLTRHALESLDRRLSTS